MATTEQLSTALAGRYEIERRVGEGGMATVYLARDAKHDRQVALKVLKPELGAVLGVERFLSEIKVTANLQHPNLLPLFDSGEAGGLLYYVMPYVAGESLRTRLEREKQLPIDEAVRIAAAVGAALDYAHRHGVIHRDLKPENVLLHDGQPVVADFGIALAVSNAGGARVTQTGLSLGTPQYMSPEQASGDRTIDARSDIYSLAAMTFEMISGEPPHSGPTAQAIIAKLMTTEPPPLSTLRKTTPIHVEAAVTKALAKLPADRFTTAREFVDALEGRGLSAAMLTVTGMQRTATDSKPSWRQPVVVGLSAALLAAAAFGVVQWRAAHRRADTPVVRFHVEVPSIMLVGNSASGRNMVISPDGKTLAYANVGDNGASRLYVRPFAVSAEQVLPGTEGAQQPTFSPDGAWIAYLVRDEVWRVPTAGGTPVLVGPTRVSAVGMSWSPSGLIYIGGSASLLSIPASGGPVTRAVVLDSAAGESYANSPLALDDGDHVLFSVQGRGGVGRSTLAMYSRKTGKVTRFEVGGLHPLLVASGRLFYVASNGTLNVINIDVSRGRLTSDPVSLGVTALTRTSGAADAAISPTGTLVYQAAASESQLGWVTQSGAFTPMWSTLQAYAYPRLSPDGSRVAVSVGVGLRTDIWSFDIASATPTRITSGGTTNERPEWTPDGKRVLFRTDGRGRLSELWWRPVDLSSPAEPLQSSDAHDFYEGVITPDDRYLVYQIDDARATQADVMYRALTGDTTSKPIAATNAVEAQARVSPDGKWVAYETDLSGTSQVMVQPMGGGAQVQVSSSGGSEPVWSRDGQRLFYRDGRNLIAARVRTTGGFEVVGRDKLFVDEFTAALAPHANYDVSLDGTRFLMIKAINRPEINVVYGWFSEVSARLPK